jgi:hypothetical protein
LFPATKLNILSKNAVVQYIAFAAIKYRIRSQYRSQRAIFNNNLISSETVPEMYKTGPYYQGFKIRTIVFTDKEGYRARRSVWGGVQLRSLGSSGSKLKVKIIV